MNILFRLSVIIISFVVSTNVFAGGWQAATTVAQYVVEGSSEGDRIYGDTEKGKYLFSTIMSAKAAGQTIKPLVSGCDDWDRPIVTGLWVL